MTLLPVIRNILFRMLLERIKNGVDKKLRPKRSTAEHTFILHEKTGRLAEEASRLGLKETLRTECTSSREKTEEEVDDVEEFTYLRAIVDKEGGGSKDIMHRLQEVRDAFQRLRRVWATREIGKRTKIRLFKALACPVPLYGCETWKITKNNDRELNSFQCRCLRWILQIRWQQRITNKRVVELAKINGISCEVRQRRWNCFTSL